MDQIGNLELSWAQGYSGGKANYIDKDVICYLCGHNIKFVAEDGAETVFNFPGEGVGPFAAHSLSRCFAVAEQCLNPKIYVFIYPTFRQMSILEKGAKLEYSQLFFSSSDFLCSLSGIPEFELTLWNFQDGSKLCTFALSRDNIPTSLSFNPGNWRQICVTTEKTISLLTIEQSDKYYVMQPSRVRLPPTDPDVEEEDERDRDIPTRASTRMTRYTVDVPKAARAGLVGEMAEKLDDIQDLTDRVKPVSQIWTPIGDLYIGCKGGQLIKVDGESHKARVIYYPPKVPDSPGSRMSSAGIQRESMIDMKQPVEDVSDMLLEGSVNCIGLHKRGLYCAGLDGTVRLVDVKSSDVNVIEKCHIGVPITSMAFSPSFRHLVLGSSHGTLHLYEPGAPNSLKLLKDLHHGLFVGISCLPGNEHCVTCREDGEVQVWSVDKGHLVSTCNVGMPVFSVACSPMLHVCAVGTAGGFIYYLDMTNVEEPRVIQGVRVYEGPVMQLVYQDEGRYLLSASEEGHIFIIDGRATENFKPLAHTDAKGEIQTVTTYTDAKNTMHVVVTHNTSGNKRMGANYLTIFEVSDDVMRDLRYNCNSLKYDFKDKSIKKVSMRLAVPSYGAAISEGNTMFTMAQNNKAVQQHTLPSPEELPKDLHKFRLEPVSEFQGHQLPGGRVLLSPHHKWLSTYGADGSVLLRTIGQMDKTVCITPHDYRTGGVKSMAFGEDSQNIFTTGYDGVLTCYSWNYTPTGIGKAKSAMEAARAKKSRLMTSQKEENQHLASMADWTPEDVTRPSSDKIPPMSREEKEKVKREEAFERDEIYKTPTPVPEADATWLQVQELESFKEEDKQYADVKKNLRVSIRDMRRTLQTMLKNNETLPEIEQLNRHEFDLDIEEQLRLQAEADQEVERVREEIEFENLAKMYLREMIKRECWDDMVVKGRAVQAFNSNLEVSNFPMRERLPETVKLIEKVTKRRHVEIAEAKARKELIETMSRPTLTTAMFLSMLQQKRYGYGLDDELGEGEDDEGKEQPSTTGSLGAQYGGGNELFYSQFELHSREQKINQIVLLEDAIFRIKQVFNKDFDELFVKKEQEINRIKEKNKRIRKIIADLDLAEEVIEPSMGVAEKPETLLTVEDEEVKVERYYTPEQKKAMEKKQKEEEDRRARERGDNARERALNQMMGGVLEIKKEDELKKDIPKPAFITQKDENDWSEEEQKLAKEYEKKVKELQEEREKYRKQLETELRKNQSIIQEGMAGFDDMLNTVFMKKIKVMMVIYQMPRGRGRRPAPNRRRQPRQAQAVPVNPEAPREERPRTRAAQQQATGRDTPPVDGRPDGSQKRGAAEAELDEFDNDPALQSNAGRYPVIDFERLMRESQIVGPSVPNSVVPRNSSQPGCGNETMGNFNDSNHFSRPTSSHSSEQVPSMRTADDDIAAHVPTSLKQKICRGEYVNLALLLKGAVELDEYCNGSVFKLNSEGHIETSQKECREKIDDVEKWTNAFIIYTTIYLSNHADKVYEMLHYMYNIRECAIKNGGQNWREYDQQFRLRQARSLAPWSKINNDLWWRCMQMRPVLKNAANPYRYTCNDYNKGSCTWPNCRFSHVCTKCFAPHPEIHCVRSGSGTNTHFRTESQRPFRGRPYSNRRGTFRGPRRY